MPQRRHRFDESRTAHCISPPIPSDVSVTVGKKFRCRSPRGASPRIEFPSAVPRTRWSGKEWKTMSFSAWRIATSACWAPIRRLKSFARADRVCAGWTWTASCNSLVAKPAATALGRSHHHCRRSRFPWPSARVLPLARPCTRTTSGSRSAPAGTASTCSMREANHQSASRNNSPLWIEQESS